MCKEGDYDAKFNVTRQKLSHSGLGFGNFFDHCGVLFAASALAAAGYFKLFDEK